MSERKLCPICHQRPVAINRHVAERVYYRKVCDVCSRLGKKIRPDNPAWLKSGYAKKDRCEKCGFKAKHPEQLGVFYIDGNLKNNNWANLRTVCLNCQIDVRKTNLPWRASPLLPDV